MSSEPPDALSRFRALQDDLFRDLRDRGFFREIETPKPQDRPARKRQSRPAWKSPYEEPRDE